MGLVADIIKVEYPPTALAGAQVTINVSVKNLGLAPAGYNYIGITGVFDSSILSFQYDYLYVDPQAIVIFSSSFIMPSKNVKVTIWSWYWDGSKWALDETFYIDISLTVVVSEFSELLILSLG